MLGADSLMVYVTDYRRSIPARDIAKFDVPDAISLVDRNSLHAYYSACIVM